METNILILMFRDFFNEEPPTIEGLCQEIPTQDILRFAAYISALIHGAEVDHHIQNFILGDIKVNLPDIPIRELKEKEVAFTHYACLRLICLALEQDADKTARNIVSNGELEPTYVSSLFQSCLLINQEINSRQEACTIQEAKSIQESLIYKRITICLPTDEFVNEKSLPLQLVKGRYLFQFMERDSKFSKYLPLLLEKHRVNSWEDYLSRLLEFYINCTQTETGFKVSRLKVPEQYKDMTDFLNSLSLNTEQVDSRCSEDFSVIRNFPLFKLSNQEYIILNFNFFIDRFFQGIYFELRALIELIDKKAAKNLHATYSKEFIEQELFISVMDDCLEKHPNISCKRPGEGSREEYSDYYLRVGDDIFLFEMKNSMIRADCKSSYNFKTIKNELYKKFVTAIDDRGQREPKGVQQLVNRIIEMRDQGGFSFDRFNNDLKISKVVVHPVIVYTDDCLTTDGINYLLNQIFQCRIQEHTFPFAKIAPLVMISLDELLQLMPLFQAQVITFGQIFHEYNTMTAIAAQNNSKTLDDEPHNSWEYIGFHYFISEYLQHRRLPAGEALNRLLLQKIFADKSKP